MNIDVKLYIYIYIFNTVRETRRPSLLFQEHGTVVAGIGEIGSSQPESEIALLCSSLLHRFAGFLPLRSFLCGS